MRKTLALIALSIGTAAFAAAPASAQVYGRVGVHIGPPPAPIVERVPPPPGRDYAWHGGHWQWNGGRYVWIRGGYWHRPHGRAAWVPGHWVHGPHGWFYRDGHWA